MKKPNFIEIRLPGNKSAFEGARGKYLKRLVDRVLEVNFAREKERKIFEYSVTESRFYQSWTWHRKEATKYWTLKLELKVPKEDLKKVL